MSHSIYISGVGFRIASGPSEFQSYQDIKTSGRQALPELDVQLKNARPTQGRLFKSSIDSGATTVGSRGLLLFQDQLLHRLTDSIRLCPTHGWQIKGAEGPVARIKLREAKDEWGGFLMAVLKEKHFMGGSNTW